MTLTSRRPRPLDRTIPHRRDTRIVFIATEGSYTEKQYFDIFRCKSSRVQVKVLPTEKGESAPKHVLSRLKAYRKEVQCQKDDQFWLVIDKDRWPNGQLSQIASESSRCKFGLAVSRPCFEIWLLLHYSDLGPDMEEGMSRQEIEILLRGYIGAFDRNNLKIDLFAHLVNDAVQRAKILDVRPGDRWPNQLGTRVYRVVEAINALI